MISRSSTIIVSSLVLLPLSAQFFHHMAGLIEDIADFLLKVKMFRNIVTQQKPKRRFQQPPPSLYYGGGVTLLVLTRVEGIELVPVSSRN